MYLSYEVAKNMNTLDLRKVNTRQLLKFVREWRLDYDALAVVDKVKKELANRPHIPNKREGQAMRREMAKRGR